VLDKGKLVIVDVRIEPAPAKPEDGAIDAPVAAASVEEAPAGAAETESTQYKREPVILVLKRLFPPDGLRPKGRSVKWVTNSLNKLPEFKDNPVSEDTVYRAWTWKPPSKNNSANCAAQAYWARCRRSSHENRPAPSVIGRSIGRLRGPSRHAESRQCMAAVGRRRRLRPCSIGARRHDLQPPRRLRRDRLRGWEACTAVQASVI